MTDQYDVAIMGTGFEGGLLGIILASQGAKVLMIDHGTHPRFALGESTVRHTFKMLKIIGERFQIPVIQEKFSRASLIHERVTSSCGEKRNFGFLYHREGQHQIPQESNQLRIVPFREGYEAHLYRQDIDAWLTYSAIHYGAKVRYNTKIAEAEFKSDGATLVSTTGEKFHARYVVDCSGQSAQLAKLLGVKEKPPRLKLNTRCLFTHMIDVKPYDELPLPYGIPQAPEKWYNGTCHHIFDGGWLWVIPFNNRAGSTNPAVSVGLSYDNVRYPRPTDITPDQEWRQFLEQYPSVKAQFKDAKVIRDWVSTDRLQSSCSQGVGERWCLTAASYGSGFIDALFSRGLSNSVEVISALAPRLLKALKDDDFSPERFAHIEEIHRNNLYYNDRLVESCYIGFRDFRLWDVWFRIWAMGVGLGDLRLANILRRFSVTHDESVLPDSEEAMGLFFSNNVGYREVFNKSYDITQQVAEGTLASGDAASQIIKMLGAVDFVPPAIGFGDPNSRYVNIGDPKVMAGSLRWVMSEAPPEVKNMTLGSFSDIGPMRLLLRNKTTSKTNGTVAPA